MCLAELGNKDAFAQTVVSEIALIKKKNSSLHKENHDLLKKVKQLDEDTDDGIIMLMKVNASLTNN